MIFLALNGAGEMAVITPFVIPNERVASRPEAGSMTRPLLMAVSKTTWAWAVVERAARKLRRDGVIWEV